MALLKNVSQHDILKFALIGMESERNRIEALLGTLRNSSKASLPSSVPSPKKTSMSSAARKRMSQAQKKRWAAAKANQQSSR